MLSEATTLHPRLRGGPAVAELRSAWRTARCLRVPEVLAPGLADTLANAALGGPFELLQHDTPDFRCLFYRRFVAWPAAGVASDFAPVEAARQLVMRDIPALASAIAGHPLSRPPVDGIIFDAYRKGSYLDEHTDQAPDRLVAYVLGLTRDHWPADRGGHLEFLGADATGVIERRPPGWDTLDLYDMYPILRWHRIPILRDHALRVTSNGWLTGEVMGPWET